MQTNRWVASLSAFVFVLLAGPMDKVAAQDGSDLRLTQPLPGLTSNQLSDFAAGKVEFERHWRRREGLGPLFNARACAACHRQPDVGGAGPRYRSNFNFGRQSEAGFDPLTEQGGPLLQEQALQGVMRETIPDEANVASLRQVAPLFGSGLVEAIPDEQIQALADPNDTNGDGISGRVVFNSDGRVQRFGSQNHVASLESFVRQALENEIGITQEEVPPQTVPLMRSFISFLAPLPRGEINEAVGQGEAIFHEIGCTGCHTPSFTTSPGLFTTADGQVIDVAALQGVQIFPYSDFLLHDIGLDDGVTLGSAESSEYRTIPLWGLRFRRSFLHDGRAANLRQALLFHGGEALAAREAAFNLTSQELRLLEAFLKSL